ncbi:sulfite exporter TauE/SafE family protein [Salibaculum sp.]|uniref:sulfite exporter TauE/SafE family protein n=1 Tax=Salibaculum sp. TaxID=2855480 RepID=UPI002B46207A|nr:sulfite exporter TauE/SafE family protein [Salibaculum sp.]HKL69138.1 sulfite exporter TauE/SafE family protein [Salibaculum sp.]
MDGPLFWSLALLASVCVGMGKGGLPAVAMLSVPLLSLVINPVTAAGLLLPVYIVSDIFGVWAYRHVFDRRVLTIGMAGLTIGTGIGWVTAGVVPEWVVRLIIGGIGTSFAASLLLSRGRDAAARPANKASGLFWTSVSGFTSFVSHSGGPPWQVWVLPLRLSKLTFAGTTTIAFAYANALKLVPYAALGQLGLESLRVAAVLVLPAVLAVFVGLKLVKILPEALFFRFVTWALLGVSTKLIWDGLTGGLAG